MKILFLLLKITFLSLFPLMVFAQFSPIGYLTPGFVYSQNFDSLPVSINYSLPNKGPFSFQAPPISINSLAGWFFLQVNGTAAQAGWTAGSGTSTNHGIYSSGAANNKERSLGSLSSSGGSYVFGLILINQTGKTLNQLSITAQIEQWRKGGSGKKNTWYCKAKTGNWQALDTSNWIACPEGNFSSPISSTGVTALNGNLPENTQTLNFQMNRFIWKNGEKLTIAWFDPDEAGNDDLCSIDQFQFYANQQITAPKIDSFRIDSLTHSLAVFSCQIATGGGNTSVECEWDSLPSFNYPEPLPISPVRIPDFEPAASIKGRLTSVIPGSQYYVRWIANNETGSTISDAYPIVIPNLPPRVVTYTPTITNSNQIEVSFSVEPVGKSIITESGIQVSSRADFTIFSNILSKSTLIGNQKFAVEKLPAGTRIWLRAFAINKEGLFTGNVVSITTPTSIQNFKLTGSEITNSDIINYQLQTTHAIQGITVTNFSVISNQIKNASVVQISGTQNNFMISVQTGNGDGDLQLQLNTLNKIEPSIFPTSNFANGICQIDKTPPVIRNLYYANLPYRSGDTVQLYFQVNPEKYGLQMVSGKWAGINLYQFQKINDSLFLSNLVLPEGKLKLAKEEGISVMIQLKDSAGNLSSLFQKSIFYSNDEVDTVIPEIVAVQQPEERTYATGDTLEWKLTFSKPVFINNTLRKPYISISIGNSTRQAQISFIKDSTVSFRYIIKSGDNDSVGISWKKYILLNGNKLTDSIGNNALLNFEEYKQTKILIDGIAPEITQIVIPPAKFYLLSDSLFFLVQFSERIVLIDEQKNIWFSFSTQSGNLNASLIRISQNQLIFGYKVPRGIWDKKGIQPIGIHTSKTTSIRDTAGNPANLIIPGNFSNTGIFIDASIPYFQDSSQLSISFCNSDSTLNLSKHFSWNSPETGEKIKVGIEYFSGKQVIFLANNLYITNGIFQQPIIHLLIRDKSKISPDTIIISISDSFYTTTKKLILLPVPAIQNNFLISPPTICSGEALLSISGSDPKGGNGLYTYSWEMANSYQSPFISFGEPDSISRFILPHISQSALLRRKIVSGPCSDYSAGIWIPVKGYGLWTGKKSSDWNDSGNWCQEKIPTADISVVIPGGAKFSPEINKNGYCDTLEIHTGGSLLINGTLEVGGELLAPPASIYASDGTLFFKGARLQGISGSLFFNKTIGGLQLQNQLGLMILDSLQVKAHLCIQKGFIQTNHQLIMKEGAVVGPSAEASLLLGNVQVSNTIQSAKRQYIFSSHPFRNPQPLQVLADQVDITGSLLSNPPFAASPKNMPSAYRLVNSIAGQCEESQPCWKPFVSLNNQSNEYWKAMEGIRWLFRGKKGTGNDDEIEWLQKPFDSIQQVTVHFSGELNMGDQVLSFADTTEGYQLIGNPYLCPIDVRRIQFSDSIAPFCWIWDANQGISGGFTCHSINDSIVIPPFATFIIKLNGKNGHQIIFSEKSKVYPNNTLSDNYKNQHPALNFQLYQDSIFLDQVIIQHDYKSFSGKDDSDGVKIMNPSHNLYTQSFDKQCLSIDQRPISAKTYIPLLIDNISPGNYELRCKLLDFGNQENLQLIDFYSLKYYPLVKDTILPFQVNTDTLSNSSRRFVIAGIHQLVDPFNTIQLNTLTIWPNPAQDFVNIICKKWPKEPCNIRILDAMGNLLRMERKQLSENEILQINTRGLTPGIQLIVIQDQSNSFQAWGKWLKQ
ncbi:MAG: hypothetical protein EBX50_04805 [Chitinophagia bacterium]|nr:hypothetical protein [Chitinophagia bacterium]